MKVLVLRVTAAVAITTTLLAAPAFAATQCSATSGATVPVVVELYTSEGCDSCPPADRWLSKTVTERSNDAAFIALAFHVDYWDYIGWKDPFAQPAFAQRQAALAKSGGASGVYTPQIFVNGKDDRSWTSGVPRQSAGGKLPATAKFSVVSMWRDDSLNISGMLATPAGNVRLRYAVTENGLVSAVKAGENRGVTLRHDAVVRAHGSINIAGNGTFALNVPLPRAIRPSASQLHLIAEDLQGSALAAATLACAK